MNRRDRPLTKHQRQLRRGRARRSSIRTWSGAPAEHVGVTGAWFATLADLDEAKAASHDSLVQLMGAGREGPVAWSWWTGEAALDHLARWRHSGPIRSAEHLEYFTELKRRLTTDGGYLIMAFAAGRMTNAS